MNNIIEYDSIGGHPDFAFDQQLMLGKRDNLWLKNNTANVQAVVHESMNVLDLDHAWDDVAKDPLKKAIANAIWSSTLACFGPKLCQSDLADLNAQVTGIPVDGIEYKFTSNHLSVPVKLCSIYGVDNQTKESPMIHYMPAFATSVSGQPTIGEVSPILLENGESGYFLSLMTPSGHIWKKSLEVIPFKDYVQTSIKNKSDLFTAVVLPCVSNFQVLNVRPTCQEGCLMCTVEKGDGQISSDYKDKAGKAIDILIQEAAKTGHAFQLSISGGSLENGDAGFESAHGWALKLLKIKLDALDVKIPVQLQLETILPAEKTSWLSIIQTISQYVNDYGWQVSLAINIEAVQDEWKHIFMPGPNKSVTTVDDHIAFAQMLSHATNGKVQINSLVLFGMFPFEMKHEDYLNTDLLKLSKLVAAGIKPDFQPVKIENSTKLKAYPVPNPIHLMVQDLALKVLIKKAGLGNTHGCVGGCNACDQSHETSVLIMKAKNSGKPLFELIEPLVQTIGPDYAQTVKAILSSSITEKGVIYEAN